MLGRPTGLYPDKETVSLGNVTGDLLNLFSTDASRPDYYISMKSGKTYDTDWQDKNGTWYTNMRQTDCVRCAPIPVSGGEILRLETGSLYSHSRYKIGDRVCEFCGVWLDSDGQVIGRLLRETEMRKYVTVGAEPLDGDTDLTDGSAPFDITVPSGAAELIFTAYANSGCVIRRPASYRDRLIFSATIPGTEALKTYTDAGTTRCRAALILWTGNKYVHFFFDSENNSGFGPVAETDGGERRIVLSLPVSKLTGEEITGTYAKQSSDGSFVLSRSVKLFDLLSLGQGYSWKIRVYSDSDENGSVVGYGTVNSLFGVNFKNADGTYSDAMRLQIFPHINIYDNVLDGDVTGGSIYNPSDKNNNDLLSEGSARREGRNLADAVFDIMKFYDKRIKYTLIAAGKTIPIDEYRLYPKTYEKKSNGDYKDEPKSSLDYAEDFDSYGNAKAGYAITVSGRADAANIESETYRITANYSDSRWGYFEFAEPIAVTIQGGRQDTSSSSSEFGTYEVVPEYFSGVSYSFEVTDPSSVGVAYWSYKIYQYVSDIAEYMLEYASPIMFSNDFTIGYEDFLPGNLYKLTVSVTDGRDRTVTKEEICDLSDVGKIYFTDADGQTVVVGENDDLNVHVSAKYYKPHNSVIVNLTALNTHLQSSCRLDVAGYKIYKTLGETGKKYKVAEIPANDGLVVEDFIIGDGCEVVYYIYPYISGDTLKLCYPAVTEPLTLSEGVDKVVGLNYLGENVYEVNTAQLWRLWLNLDDSGYTINTDKNFAETLAVYNQQITGNRNYITKSVSALLGTIDCGSGQPDYVDRYDYLISWNRFTADGKLKCLVDARGLVLPGDFDVNPTVEYMKTPGSPAVTKFTWRQLADLDTITILGTVLPFDPTDGVFVQSSENWYLQSHGLSSGSDGNDELLYGR